jgi:hypothetical protein
MSADAPISKDQMNIATQLRNAARYVTTTEALAKTTLYWLAALEYERIVAERDQYKQQLIEAQQLSVRQGNEIRTLRRQLNGERV